MFIGLAGPGGNGARVFHIVEPSELTREELKREFSERALEILRMALCECEGEVVGEGEVEGQAQLRSRL